MKMNYINNCSDKTLPQTRKNNKQYYMLLITYKPADVFKYAIYTIYRIPNNFKLHGIINYSSENRSKFKT